MGSVCQWPRPLAKPGLESIKQRLGITRCNFEWTESLVCSQRPAIETYLTKELL